jgi:anhydro-N-acetylmuramic acid kinase
MVFVLSVIVLRLFVWMGQIACQGEWGIYSTLNTRIFAAMVYKVIGLMSGSSLDGLDIAYVHLQERAATSQLPKSWDFSLLHTACYPYSDGWGQRLGSATALSALDYQVLHVEYGHYLGEQVLRFIEEFGLHYQVQLVVSHGHTTFHWPARQLTAQLGDGAAIAAETRINVVSDLRAMDLALGGQGAPIVPIGEKLLLPGYEYFLNLGGIANISRHGVALDGDGGEAAATTAGGEGQSFFAFDVCPANRVLNALALLDGKPYDDGGAMAATGAVDNVLLQQLNALSYYGLPYPKSLANDFGTETVLPLVLEVMRERGLSVSVALRTYVEHIAVQIGRAVEKLGGARGSATSATGSGAMGSGTEATPRMLITGGGAHNTFLVERLRQKLGVEVVVPDENLADFKEALIMALIGVLRWREENNVMASVTGASRDSIGGAVWIGQEA